MNREPRSYCSDRRRDWGRRCSLSAGRPGALAAARLFGFPLAKLFRSLLPASAASTAVARRLGGPGMLRLTFLDQDKEEEAACRAWHPLQVSGAEAWLSSAARPPPARSRRGPRRCSESSTAPASALVWAARRPGCGACCRRGPPGRAPSPQPPGSLHPLLQAGLPPNECLQAGEFSSCWECAEVTFRAKYHHLVKLTVWLWKQQKESRCLC